MYNALNWFEIPVTDIDRAAKFYSTILAAEMEIMETMPGFKMAFFPAEEGVGGGIIQGEGHVPSAEGTVVYLNGGDDLSTVLDRVAGAGGSVITAKMDIGEHGFIGMFMDTEGNRLGLHSMA